MTQPQGAARGPRRERLAALLLAGVAALLAGISPVANTASDPALGLLAAQALVDHGSLSLDPFRGDPACPRDLGRDRRLRAWRGSLYYFAPGVQVLSAPLVWAGRRAGLDMCRAEDEAWLQNLLSALLIAVDTLLLASLLRKLCAPGPALTVTAVLMLGSPLASTLATAFWAAGLAVPLLLLALHLVAACGEEPPGRWRLAAVLAVVAAAYSCRPAAACFLPGLLAHAWRRRPSWRAALLGLAAGAAAALALLLVAPLLPRYFSPAKLQPQTPLLLGLYGTLLSPSRGLLVFCPFAAVVLAAAVPSGAWRRPLFRLAAVWLATQVLLLSIKGNWWGGHSYGPRLLTEAVPALGLMAALAWISLPRARRGPWAAAFLASGALAVAIHSGQGLWNPAVQAFNRGPDPRSAQGLVLWWRYPQFLATADSVRRRDLEFQERRLRPLAPGDEARWMTDQVIFDGFQSWEIGLRRAGPESRLRFRPTGLEPGRRYLLELQGSVLREQPVRLSLQGQTLDEAVLAPPEPHAWRVPVAAPLPGGGLVELEIVSPSAAPGGPDDPRLLGFTYHALRLVAEPPPPQERLPFDHDLGFLRGFAEAEAGGRWTRAQEAVLRLPRPRTGCPCRLEVEAGALGRQRVEAWTDRRLADWTFEGLERRQIQAADLADADPPERLTLRLPDARATAGDPRRLGLRLFEVRLTSAAPRPTPSRGR